MLSRTDRIPERDRQTDRRTDKRTDGRNCFINIARVDAQLLQTNSRTQAVDALYTYTDQITGIPDRSEVDVTE